MGERDLVLRRPPAGSTTAESARDVLGEYHVLDALRTADVPVPRAVASCDDRSVIGAEFDLMDGAAATC